MTILVTKDTHYYQDGCQFSRLMNEAHKAGIQYALCKVTHYHGESSYVASYVLSTVTGGPNPLAQLDPREVDTKHIPDPDSPLNENARTISVRVQAVAHYDNGDVRGEARRVISVTNEKNVLDRDLLPGFPMNLGASVEASPKLADIDGDGIRDIVAPDSSGKVHVS
ncbi:hypothetical protein [Salmonella enterica]|uniref:hypothetical protein n=1 Tax=Salmonella enterica TaxID=28901 RepID=UPI0021586CDF|nr:hypothetical protein [Salmonella enterica]